MKTIFVDAVNAFVSDTGVIFAEMLAMLESFENPKIILTGAPYDKFKAYGLDRVPYEVFTLQHDPEKTDPAYYTRVLDHFDLKPKDTVVFEHNPKAVESAGSIGITAYFYDKDRKDIEALRAFLAVNL